MTMGTSGASSNKPKKAKTCFRGGLVNAVQVPRPGKFQQCARSPAVADYNRPASERTTALAGLSSKMVPFVLLQNRFNLRTLAEDKSMTAGLPSNFKEGNCVALVHGLYNSRGERIFKEPLPVLPKKPDCQFTAMNGTTASLNSVLTTMQDGQMETNLNAISRFEGTDGWSNCKALVDAGLTDTFDTMTIKSTRCTIEPPEPCFAGQTPFAFCLDNPENKWCKDPCCNLEAQKTKCCAERDVEIQVKSSSVNDMAFGFSCPHAGADAIDGIEVARSVAKVSQNPQDCFGKNAESKKRKLNALKSAAECCYATIFGNDPAEEMFAAGGASGGSSKRGSIQTCSTDADCYSGTCIKTQTSGGSSGGSSAGGSVAGGSGGSSGGSSSTGSSDASPPNKFKKCFTAGTTSDRGPFTTKGKQYFCALAPMETAGTALAQCLKDRFDSDAGSLSTAWAILSEQYGAGGDANAPLNVIGDKLINTDTQQTCEGETGWLYNADDFFVREVYGTCTDAADCATKCTQETKCNWAPTGTKLTEAECLNMIPDSPKFCADTEGARYGMPSRTKSPVCKASSIKIFGFPDTHDEWGGYGLWWGTRRLTDADKDGVMSTFNVSSAGCAAVGNAGFSPVFGGAFREDMAQIMSMNFEDMTGFTMPEKKAIYGCGLPNARTQSDCLGECLSVLKPSQKFRCEMDPDSDGACPQYWMLERQQLRSDWATGEPSEYVPPVCVPGYLVNPAGTNKPYTGFSNGVLDGGSYADWPWDFLETATASRCTDLRTITGLENVRAKVMDSGEAECASDMCYFANTNGTTTTVTESDCWSKVNSTYQSFYESQWHATWADGQGACVIKQKGVTQNNMQQTMQDSGWGYVIYGDEKPRKASHVNTFQSVCTSAFGGTFYTGRMFEEGKYDSSDECAGTAYCEIEGLKVTGVTEAQCGINKECKEPSGFPAMCEGCERDWNDWSAPGGACIKKVTNQTSCSTASGQIYYPDVNGGTGAGVCLDPNKYAFDCNGKWQYLTCIEDIAGADCKATAVGQADFAPPMQKISQRLKCRPSMRSTCKTKAECESGGFCQPNMDMLAASDPFMMDMRGMDMGGIPKEISGPRPAEKMALKTNVTGANQGRNDTFMMSECLVPLVEWSTPYWFEYVCKIDMDDVADAMNPCNADDKYARVVVNKCSGEVTDPFLVYRDGACYDYLMTQAQCTGTGKTWVPTGESKATCEAQRMCVGSDSIMGEVPTFGRSPRECTKCGGEVKTANKWMKNTFVTPRLQNTTGLVYKNRAMESINKLIITPNKDAFMRKMMQVKKKLEAEDENQAMMCYYGRTAQLQKVVASVCEKDRAMVSEPAEIDVKNMYTTAATNTAGSPEEAQLTLGKSSFDSSTVGLSLKAGMSMDPMTPSVGTGSSPRRLSLDDVFEMEKRVLATAASTTDSGCYATVYNSGGHLVGQLTGDCFQMKSSQAMQGSAKLCLTEKSEIKKNTALYPVADFAVRSGPSGSYSYMPAGLTVTKNGEKLCASVSSVNTFYCAAAVVANAAAKTSDTGTASCPALEAKLEKVSQAAQLAGGSQIPGTAALDLSGGSSDTTVTTAAPVRDPGTVVQSTMGLAFDMPDTIQESSLKSLFGDPIQEGIAKAAGSTVQKSWVIVNEIKFGTRRELAENVKHRASMSAFQRRLAAKSLAVDYSIYVPNNATGASSLVQALATKMSSGSTTSAAFQTSLATQIQAATSAALGPTFKVTGVTVTGTASRTTVGAAASSSASGFKDSFKGGSFALTLLLAIGSFLLLS
ncbi:unnamed protein product [Amoebophrya sp. A25]|nr:unnamed protein product [Amoebophrya sp. A25]|eukprot:GSA25T00010707001.1